MRLFTAATALSIGTVAFLALAVPRLATGYDERAVRRELQEATQTDTLDQRVRGAVAQGDVALARQYRALGMELGKPLDPTAAADLAAAERPLTTLMRNAGDFASAYVTGRADSAAGLAGAVVSDLTVVGDVRDLVTEGGKAVVGAEYSALLLALAGLGLAAESATVATGGSSLVLKAGLSLLKVAKRTGNLTATFAADLTRLARTASRVGGGERRVAANATRVARADATPPPSAAAADAVRAARTQLGATLIALTTVADNAGAAEAVKLMRTVRTSEDARRLATFSGRFGRRSRAVVELTGRTTLRAFRLPLRGLRLLLALAWSFLGWLAGLLVLRLARSVLGAVWRLVRATTGAFVPRMA